MSKSPSNSEVDRFLDAWFALRQMIQAANFNRFQSAGLSATQFMTLNLLPDKGAGVSMGELARRMNLKPATVAKTVGSLEERGMLMRNASAEDGRRVLVRITEEGAALQNSAAGQFRDHISRLFRTMLPEQRKGLIEGLESLVRAGSETRPAEGEALTPTGRGAGRQGRKRRQSPRG